MAQVHAGSPRFSIRFWGVIGLALIGAWMVYQPGLLGTFQFDDFANLPALGAYGPVDNWTTFLRYITSGIADPTGRPLSMLSFLIDAQDWPADPFPFKRTNVVLHLINSVLLALTLRRFGQIAAVGDQRTVDLTASLGATLWLLHPLWVSTTLYVVQREAMLPVTFTLLGLLGFCRGSAQAARGERHGVWTAGLLVVLFTLLASACKANGALLPLLIWVTDALLIAPRRNIPDPVLAVRFTWMKRIVLEFPTVILIVWLLTQGVLLAAQGILPIRGWTIGQRLLTESRVVCDYLHLLWLPRPYTAGLFNDSVVVSEGLFSPVTTFFSIIFLCALLAFALSVRRRAPLLAFAILFFAAGHLLESTVIPLELYYEHRNYLPAMFLFWPVTHWLSDRTKLVPIVRRALMVIIPVVLAGMTYQASTLWGDARQQAEMWAAKNPGSPRAQSYAAQVERDRGRPDLAIRRLTTTHIPEDEDVQVALNLLGTECEINQVQPGDVERADRALRAARITGQLGYNWFSEAIDRIAKGHACRGLEADVVQRLVDAANANPSSTKLKSRAQDNLSLRGQLALAQGDPKNALIFFERALDLDPKPEPGLASAARLAGSGHAIEALALLDHLNDVWRPSAAWGFSMGAVHERLLYNQGYWNNEISHLRSTIQKDVGEVQDKAPMQAD